MYGVLKNTTEATQGDWTARIYPAANGFYRCTLSLSSTATQTGAYYIAVDNSYQSSYAGDGTSGLYVWGAQMEAGEFASSYIQTTTASATRAADVASITGANFSSFYNQSAGTLFGDAVAAAGLTGGRAFSLDGNSHSDAVYLTFGALASHSMYIAVGGVAQTSIGTRAVSGKVADAYALDDFATAVNGATVVTDSAGLLPAVDKAYIGADWNGVGAINGHIRRLAYYPSRLTNAQLQALTT